MKIKLRSILLVLAVLILSCFTINNTGEAADVYVGESRSHEPLYVVSESIKGTYYDCSCDVKFVEKNGKSYYCRTISFTKNDDGKWTFFGMMTQRYPMYLDVYPELTPVLDYIHKYM